MQGDKDTLWSFITVSKLSGGHHIADTSQEPLITPKKEDGAAVDRGCELVSIEQ